MAAIGNCHPMVTLCLRLKPILKIRATDRDSWHDDSGGSSGG